MPFLLISKIRVKALHYSMGVINFMLGYGVSREINLAFHVFSANYEKC